MAAFAKALTRKLLKIGGCDVDVMLADPYLEGIVERGKLFDSTRVRIVRGAANQCHRNAASLWLRGRSAAIATGYYLPFDGIWRQHSWSMTPSGIILDTHSGGRQYFGIRLDGMGALLFAESHCDYTAVVRWGKKNPERFAPIVAEALKEIRTATSR